ncbi:hypothetical protein PG997_003941 [Apiospora hydei]|uniref:Uncharacterized protein n=1 Tax=Apiospora hydei TaxID=1337664 RepID=A0ABR1X0S9_9PEZI
MHFLRLLAFQALGASAFTSLVPDLAETKAAAETEPIDSAFFHDASMALATQLTQNFTRIPSAADAPGSLRIPNDEKLDPRVYCPLACSVLQIFIVGWLEALKLNNTIPPEIPSEQLAEESLIPCIGNCEDARQKGAQPEKPQQQ